MSIEKGIVHTAESIDDGRQVTITRGKLDDAPCCEIEIRDRRMPYAMQATLTAREMAWLGIVVEKPL